MYDRVLSSEEKKNLHVLAQFNNISQKISSWMCVAGGLWTFVVYSVWERIFNTERYGRTKHKLHTKWKAARGWTSLQNRVPVALYTFFGVLKQLFVLMCLHGASPLRWRGEYVPFLWRYFWLCLRR